MPEKEIDIYTIQDPDTIKGDSGPHSKEDLKGSLENMERHYRHRGVHTIYVKDIDDFVRQVQAEAQSKSAKIRNLIIGAHGAPGFVYLGKNPVNGDNKELATLGKLAPFFAKGANVYLLSCRTGQKEELLQGISSAFGGVNVHGYTARIETTDYWLNVSLDVEDVDDRGKKGKHVVCFKNRCDESKGSLPYPVKSEQEKAQEAAERRAQRSRRI
jgi:hypothetical protein